MNAGTVAGRSQKRAWEDMDSLLTYLNGTGESSKRVRFDMDNNIQGDDSGLEHSEPAPAFSRPSQTSRAYRSMLEPYLESSDYYSAAEDSDVSDISNDEISEILHDAESAGYGTRSKTANVLKAVHQTPASGPKPNVSLSQVPATNGAALASPIEISDDECEAHSRLGDKRAATAPHASVRDISDKNGEHQALPALPHPKGTTRNVLSLPGLGPESAIATPNYQADVVPESGDKRPTAAARPRFVADPLKAQRLNAKAERKDIPRKEMYFCVRVGKEPGIYYKRGQAMAQIAGINGNVFKACFSADETNDFTNHLPEDCTYPLVCGENCKDACSVPEGTIIEISDDKSELLPEPENTQAIASAGLRFVADPSKAGNKKKGKTGGKYFCVRIGRVAGIYSRWKQAKAQSKSVKGAVFKSCYGMDEANDFMNHRPEDCTYPDVCGRRGRQCEEAHSTQDETAVVMQGTGGQPEGIRYFCVRSGWKPGIYHDGPSAFAQTKDFKGAVTKVCNSAEEANDFVNHRPEDCSFPTICGWECKEASSIPNTGGQQAQHNQNVQRVQPTRSRRQGQPQQTRSHRHCVCCDIHIGIGVVCEECRLSYSHRKEGVIKKHGLRSDQVIQLNKVFAGKDVRFPDTDAFERKGVPHAIRDFWAAYNVPIVVSSTTDTALTPLACVRRGNELPTDVMWRVDEGIPAVIKELFGVVQPGCGKEVVELSDDED